jgi:hypothetical protein
MPRWTAWSIVGATTLAPGVALAQSAAPAPEGANPAQPPTPVPPVFHRVQLGLGLGYSLPIGPLGTQADRLGSDISDLETAAVPIAIDAGYFARRWLYLGGSLVWGPGSGPHSTGSTCTTPGVHCFRQDAQLLAEARVYMTPAAPTRAWVSVDVGWELATFATSVGASTLTSTYSGPILFDGRLGFEGPVGPLTIAPYLGVAVGEFVTRGLNPSSAPVGTWIATANHEWVTVGVRLAYGL